jgi:archaellin
MSSEKDNGAVLIATAIVFAALVIVAGMVYVKTMP